MTLLLPLMGFLFVSLLIAAVALSMSQGATATIERRLGELRGPGQVLHAPRAERLTKTLQEAGQDGAAVGQGADQDSPAPDPGRLPLERSAVDVLRHSCRPGAGAVRLAVQPARRPPEPLHRAVRRGARLPAAEHGARPQGQEAPAPDPPVAARRARPAGRQRGGRPGPRPGAAARRRGAGATRTRSSRTNCGSSTSSCAPASPARRRCGIWPSAPASRTCRSWRRC